MITLLLIVGAVAVIIMILEVKEEKRLQQQKREAEAQPLPQEEPSDVTGHLPPPLEEPYTPEAPVEPVRRRPGRPRKSIVIDDSLETVPGRRSRKVH